MVQKSSFLGKVASDAQRQISGARFGYLNLPKGVGVYSPEPGTTVQIDFMPYIVTDAKHPDRNTQKEIAIPGSIWYKHPFKTHRIGEGTNTETIVCPTSFGKPCPICEHRQKRQEAGADKKELQTMNASRRNLYIVNPLDDPKFTVDKFYVFDISQYLFQDELNLELKDDPNLEIFPDLFEGLSLKCRWDSATMGIGKPFAEIGKITFVKRTQQYEEHTLRSMPSLDSILIETSYEEIVKMFFDLDPEIETETNEPAIEVVASTRRQRATPEPEPKPESTSVRRQRITPESESTPLRRQRALPEPEVVASTRRQRVTPEPESTPEPANDDELCIACEGTGKTSRGNVCPICQGTGIKPTEAAIPVTNTPDGSAQSTRTVSTRTAKQAGADLCPFKHEYGVDCEKYDECDRCDMWDKCIELKP